MLRHPSHGGDCGPKRLTVSPEYRRALTNRFCGSRIKAQAEDLDKNFQKVVEKLDL